MIKLSASNKGTPVLAVGLTRDNCERMLAGQPIHFTTSNMADLPSMEVVMFAGENDHQMANVFLASGALRPDQVREDQMLKNPHITGEDVN